MAIQTTPPNRTQLPGIPDAYIGQGGVLGRVTCVAMTLLAQEGGPCLEHGGDGGAMGLMTDGTVLGHRLMVVHERATLFRMALETSFVDAVFLELFGTGRAMGIVTVGTAHLTFQHGMMRRLMHLRALLLVAGEAYFRLHHFIPDPVLGGMHLVTVATGDIAT